MFTFQYLLVGEELYLANKFIENATSGLVLLARYISAPIALRYGTFGLRSSSLSSQGRNIFFLISSEQTCIGIFNGRALSI